MQLASKGLGLGAGLSANARAAPSHLAQGARSLHVHVPRAPPPAGRTAATATATAPSTAAERLIQTTRTALTRFFTHLTAPGLAHPAAGARSLSTRAGAAVRPETIQQRLSLPARHALAPPGPRPAFLPRASPASRSTVHVGLGTARNFSTARPIFQHLAQNVPVAGRAVYEVDWDVERRKAKDKARRAGKAEAQKENAGVESLLKATEKASFTGLKELERYFPAPALAAPGVTTILLVPLAPTPTSRLPLSDVRGSAAPNLLVFSDLQDILSSHRTQSLRVSSLFARLDSGRVWEKGAAFTAHGDANGLCTLLRVEFKGWTAAMVREVTGEAGQGWCRLVEILEDEEPEYSDAESGMSSLLPSRSLSPEVDPSASVVLPTLDFSASFLASSAASSRPPASDPGFEPSEYDIGSEIGEGFSDSLSEMGSWSDISSAGSVGDEDGRMMGLGFSSAFLSRSEEMLHPREDLF
ncbi:hypothetical protein DFH11DRAFT_1509389 [Phellopilus nigrolimitatus]|nr:hypothetical protein DFH11DRAFT_1509389 [Phellopilus nigrolimitatus]